MEIMFDTVNLEQIQKGIEIYPVAGVTSNPSIIKANGKVDFFAHMNQIRSIIGKERSLHIQVTEQTAKGILLEAEALLNQLDDQVYIKIPVTEEGLKAMKVLKPHGVHITATAIYTKVQGDLAILSQADYIAPYFNRMENLNMNPQETIRHFADFIQKSGSNTKILAASFKNVGQVTEAYSSGAHSVTLNPELLHSALNAPFIQGAVKDFSEDWDCVYGGRTITDLSM